MDELIEMMNYAYSGLRNSKSGLETYEDDSEADHGDGQQVGREHAYREIIKHCAERILEKI